MSMQPILRLGLVVASLLMAAAFAQSDPNVRGPMAACVQVLASNKVSGGGAGGTLLTQISVRNRCADGIGILRRGDNLPATSYDTMWPVIPPGGSRSDIQYNTGTHLVVVCPTTDPLYARLAGLPLGSGGCQSSQAQLSSGDQAAASSNPFDTKSRKPALSAAGGSANPFDAPARGSSNPFDPPREIKPQVSNAMPARQARSNAKPDDELPRSYERAGCITAREEPVPSSASYQVRFTNNCRENIRVTVCFQNAGDSKTSCDTSGRTDGNRGSWWGVISRPATPPDQQIRNSIIGPWQHAYSVFIPRGDTYQYTACSVPDGFEHRVYATPLPGRNFRCGVYR